MMRMTQSSFGAGTGAAMMQNMGMNNSASVGKGSLAQAVLDRYNAMRTQDEEEHGKEAANTAQAQKDRFEKARVDALESFSSYSSTGARRNLGGMFFR